MDTRPRHVRVVTLDELIAEDSRERVERRAQPATEPESTAQPAGEPKPAPRATPRPRAIVQDPAEETRRLLDLWEGTKSRAAYGQDDTP